LGAALQVDRSAFRLASVIDATQVESAGSVEVAANGRQKSWSTYSQKSQRIQEDRKGCRKMSTADRLCCRIEGVRIAVGQRTIFELHARDSVYLYAAAAAAVSARH